MKPFFALACLLFSVGLSAQQLTAPAKTRPRIGLVFGMDRDYRLLSESNNSSGGGIIKSVRDEAEKPGFGKRLGADILFPLSEKWTLKTGLRFAGQGYILKMDSLTWPSENQNGMYILDPSLPHFLTFYETHFFLETPFSAQATIKKGRWLWFGEVGCSFLWYLRSRYTQNFDIGKKAVDTRREPLRALHLMNTLSFGVERFLGNGQSSVFIQPIGRFQFTPIRGGVSVQEFPYNLGAEIGLRHSL